MSLLSRLLPGARGRSGRAAAQIFLTNTLTSKKEVFIPLKAGQASLYTCGPTAYAPVHIGNLRAAFLPDILTQTLSAAGYRVHRVLNITDFGHLVSDGDAGEDKMTSGLRSEGLALTMENMRTMAERYAEQFVSNLSQINIDTSDIRFPRASDYIKEQIALIATLEQKGYAYRTPEGVYFDTSRFAGYGRLGHLDLNAQREGERAKQTAKRHPPDFVLWKPDAKLGWPSPWSQGFPGWHIECSAMNRALLGEQIDIHTGGEDLEAVHHNNEIAQSEAATGRTPFARYWLHNAFLTMNGEKASKSLGNVVYLSDIVEKGFDPLALRYFFLQAHYRTPLSFSWAALEAAQSGLDGLRRLAADIGAESNKKATSSEARERFIAAMRDDLATPQALGILWESLRSEEYLPREKWGLILDAQAHLGLPLDVPVRDRRVVIADAPENVRTLLKKREAARAERNYTRADELREAIAAEGFHVEDGSEGPQLTRE